MKKFVFTLAKVLSLKKQQLDVLKNEMSVLQGQLREIERQISELKAHFEERNGQMREEMKEGLTPLEVMTYKVYLQNLNNKELSCCEQRGRCEVAIAAKQQELVQMKSDIAGLEKLEEKQREEYRKMEQKDQERSIEEFVNQVSYAG